MEKPTPLAGGQKELVGGVCDLLSNCKKFMNSLSVFAFFLGDIINVLEKLEHTETMLRESADPKDKILWATNYPYSLFCNKNFYFEIFSKSSVDG